MTAAHCTEDVDASRMEVRVHRHDIYGGSGEHECAETVKIAEKFEHPDYRGAENDIALLRLSQVHPLPHTPWQINAVSPLIISTLALRLTHLRRAHDDVSHLARVPPAAAGPLRRLHHHALARRRQLQRCRYDCHRGGVGAHLPRWPPLRRAALCRPQAAHQRAVRNLRARIYR
eukprot:scaffold14005_cov73-Phaeocystis_antarctica.AAC.1